MEARAGRWVSPITPNTPPSPSFSPFLESHRLPMLHGRYKPLEREVCIVLYCTNRYEHSQLRVKHDMTLSAEKNRGRIASLPWIIDHGSMAHPHGYASFQGVACPVPT